MHVKYYQVSQYSVLGFDGTKSAPRQSITDKNKEKTMQDSIKYYRTGVPEA
jgi:hypothetical protein